MSTSCAHYVLPSNPDISGIGVRSAIYIQSFICIISGISAMADGVVTDDELPFLEAQALAADILGFAILVAGFAQALTFGLTPYHASILLSLAWLSSTTVAFVNFVRLSSRKPTFLNLQQAREELGLEPFALSEKAVNFNRPGRNPFFWLFPFVIYMRSRSFPMDKFVGAGLECVETHKDKLSLSTTTFLSHISLDAGNPDGVTFNLALERSVGIWEWGPRRSQDYEFCHSATATGYSKWVTSERRRHSDSEPPQSRDEVEPSSSSQLGSGRRIIVLSGRFGLLAYVLAFIIQIEGTVRANRHLQDSEEAHWTFGQTLAIIMLIPAIRDTIKYAWFSTLKKARRVKQTKLLEADITNGEVQNFISRVNQGADPNVVVASDSNQQYATALQAAAASGELLIVNQLLNRKADVNLRVEDRPWATALQAASFYGQLEIVILFLKAGADTNIKGAVYGTALQAAAYSGDLEIVRRLLKGNANPKLEGGKYGTALQAASHRGHQQVVNLLLSDPNKGVNPDQEAGQYGTALQAAACPPERHAILDKARNNTSLDTRGELEAIFSTPSSTYDVATVLLNGKASPNLEGGEFGSALQAACYCAATDIVGLLLEKGANPNISAGKLGSPLSICRRRREEMQGFERLVREYETIEALLLGGSEEAQPSR
ncbi:ankyrin repeat-containing domain protein [Panaeolus papilionaceus]|nr:ankyrin repeat-containing domain protein [Panaeolus papilionaceus]